ncbi:winged helix-turn-helix domain-containing protein [Erwinia sp. S38]|uniref:winged helix-turn-helix domain-containing protein n=1 Tax=Erwinia sp. S38 TaxID=2769338 RepID=UPI00190D8636|nr:winged helix-turn-helix domain-containing protein [Erwinia sp. S38]MBK0002039.1 winged helix-turn-helix transcriptional regulator [Erwinia sp. S38]
MKYSINNLVEFDACAGMLILLGEENIPVQLSKPGCRLLNELVTHSGITLTRDELLQNVWGNHGLSPSSNNLSNHISFLRKIFSQLGMEDIIITSPREGFRLEAEVLIVIDSQCRQEERIEEEEEEDSFTELKPDTREGKIKRFQRFINIFIRREIFNINFIILAVILFSLVIITSRFPNGFFSRDKSAFSSVGLCHVFDLESGREIVDKNKMDIVKKIINQKNINCVNKKSHIYLKTTQFTNDAEHNQQAAFLVQCFSDQRENKSKCENYLSLTIHKP